MKFVRYKEWKSRMNNESCSMKVIFYIILIVDLENDK